MFQKILRWFMKLGSKKESEWSEWKETSTEKTESGATTELKVVNDVSDPNVYRKMKAGQKRERRRVRNIKNNNKTKGAFGKPKIMRRERE